VYTPLSCHFEQDWRGGLQPKKMELQDVGISVKEEGGRNDPSDRNAGPPARALSSSSAYSILSDVEGKSGSFERENTEQPIAEELSTEGKSDSFKNKNTEPPIVTPIAKELSTSSASSRLKDVKGKYQAKKASVKSSLQNSVSVARGIELNPASPPSRLYHIAKLVGIGLIAMGVVAAWFTWIILPSLWLTTGRFEVKNTWNKMNCTVVNMKCHVECSCCRDQSDREMCCASPDECKMESRSLGLTQNCVWVHEAKYSIDEVDRSVSILDQEVLPATAAKLSSRQMMLAGAVLGVAGMFSGINRKLAISGIVLAFAVVSVQGTTKCSCQHKTVVTMTIEVDGTRQESVEKCRVFYRTNEGGKREEGGDGSHFCETKMMIHRFRKCETEWDAANQPWCQADYLNNKGKQFECWQDPSDPNNIELSGTQSDGQANTLIGFWALFTLCCCLPGLCELVKFQAGIDRD